MLTASATRAIYIIAILTVMSISAALYLHMGDIVLKAKKIENEYVLVLRGPPREYIPVSKFEYLLAAITKFSAVSLIILGLSYYAFNAAKRDKTL